MKLIATTAALALGSLLMLAPNTSHADTWHVSLNLAPTPVLYAQPVQVVRPAPVVIVRPAPVFYTPAPRPMMVQRVVYREGPRWHGRGHAYGHNHGHRF